MNNKKKIFFLFAILLIILLLLFLLKSKKTFPLSGVQVDSISAYHHESNSEYLNCLNILSEANRYIPSREDWNEIDKALRRIEKLEAAVYDTSTNRLIFVGETGEIEGPLLLEDFFIALRNEMCSLEPPGMTIDPMPGDPIGKLLSVKYFGNTENTHFGKVMFECDRLLKAYSMGEDNLTHEKISSNVESYYNLLQLGRYDNVTPKDNIWNRFWLVRKYGDFDSTDSRGKPILQISDEGNSVYFRSNRIFVNTEVMTMSDDGELVSANGLTDPGAERFANHFTNYYDDFAKEKNAFFELSELSKLVSLAKWIKLKKYDFDLDFIRNPGFNDYTPTPFTTPSHIVHDTLTESDDKEITKHISQIYGGVDFSDENFYARDTERKADFFKKIVQKESLINSEKNSWENTYESKRFIFTALPTLNTNYKKKKRKEPSGYHDLKLVTNKDPKVEKRFRIEGIDNSEIVVYDRIYLKSEAGNIFIDFGKPKIDQEKEEIYYPSFNKNVKGYYPQKNCVEFSNSTKIFFDENGEPAYFLDEKGLDFKIISGIKKFFTVHDKETNTMVHIKSDRDPQNFLSLDFIQLGQQADASVVKKMQNVCFIHDLGFSKEEMQQFIEKIPVASDGKKHVNIIVTHTDLDHYKGLTYLLDEKEVFIDEIIIGATERQIYDAKKSSSEKSKLSSIIKKIFSKDYELLVSKETSFSRFCRKGNDSIIMNKVSFFERSFYKELISQFEYSENIESYEIPTDEKVKITAIKLKMDSKDRHIHNLIFRYEHNGFSILDMGDANEKHFKELNDQIKKQEAVRLEAKKKYKGEELIKVLMEIDKYSPVNSSVDMIKWPHHAWMPTSEKTKKEISDFIKLMRPQSILINVPMNTGSEKYKATYERMNKIMEFIREIIDEEKSRGRDLQIDIISTKDSSQRLEVMILLEKIRRIMDA